MGGHTDDQPVGLENGAVATGTAPDLTGTAFGTVRTPAGAIFDSTREQEADPDGTRYAARGSLLVGGRAPAYLKTTDASASAGWSVVGAISLSANQPPATAPSYVGQFYLDVGGRRLYVATGTSDVADWMPLH